MPPGVQGDKPINLSLLKPAEIGQIAIGKGADLKLGLWDKIKDFFRPETKQATIDALVEEMQQPVGITDYLGNFEKITSHAKSEELWRFGVDVAPKQEDGGRKLNFSIGEELIASPTVNVPDDRADRIGAYVALHELRAAVTDERNALPPSLDREQYASQITKLIDGALSPDKSLPTHQLKGLRRQYGDLKRALEVKLGRLEQVSKEIAPPSDDPSHPLLARSVEDDGVRALRDILGKIDAKLTQSCGPRPSVRDLTALKPDEIQSLVDSDADLSGASARQLMEKIRQAQTSNPFVDLSNPFRTPDHALGGMTLDEMVDRGMDFTGFNLQQWTDLGKDIGNTPLEVLLQKGVTGGGFQLFGPPPPQGGLAPDMKLHPAMKLYGVSETRIDLGDLIDAKFDLSGVPLGTLAAHFAVEGSLVSNLIYSNADLTGPLQKLRDLHIPLIGAPVALLLQRGVSFQGEKIADLQRAHWDKAPIGELLHQGADFTGVSVKGLKERGASFAGVSYRQLLDQHFDLEGLGLEELTRLNHEADFFRDVPLSELPGFRAATIANAPAAGEEPTGEPAEGEQREEEAVRRQEPPTGAAPEVARLLGQGASFKGFEMIELQRQNANLEGCFVDTLLNQEQADFTGVSVKWLQDAGASLAGLNYRMLRNAGCDFGGLASEDWVQLGKGSRFFEQVSIDELLGNEQLQGKLAGFTLSDLLDRGAKLGNVSLGDLIHAGIKPDIQGLGALAPRNPFEPPINPFEPIKVKALLEAKVSFTGFPMIELQREKANLKGCFLSTLIDQEQASFAGVSVQWLKNAGASFAGVTYGQLRNAGCSFSDVTTADLQELLKAGVFKGATTLSLIGKGAEDLARALKGCSGRDLIQGGVVIGDGGFSIKQMEQIGLLKS